jgi:hypothetical protein
LSTRRSHFPHYTHTGIVLFGEKQLTYSIYPAFVQKKTMLAAGEIAAFPEQNWSLTLGI